MDKTKLFNFVESGLVGKFRDTNSDHNGEDVIEHGTLQCENPKMIFLYRLWVEVVLQLTTFSRKENNDLVKGCCHDIYTIIRPYFKSRTDSRKAMLLSGAICMPLFVLILRIGSYRQKSAEFVKILSYKVSCQEFKIRNHIKKLWQRDTNRHNIMWQPNVFIT